MFKICFLGIDNLPVLAREFNHYGVGGAQVQMTLIAKSLAMRGFEVSMVVGDYGQADGAIYDHVKTFKTYKQSAGLPVLRFIYPRCFSILTALAQANADVYVTSCAGMQVGLLALFCKFYKKTYIYRLAHDGDADPDKVLIRLWRDKKLYEYGLKNADVIWFQNNTQQECLKVNYGLESIPIKSLVEPPDIDFKLKDRKIDILWVSNLRDIKRPNLAVELAIRLPRFQLYMVGGVQPGFLPLFKSIQSQASKIKNLNFLGQIPYHDVGDLFDQSRLFVNTSDIEGFPNTYLQSWRRGVPVVAFFDPDGLIRREGLGYAVSSMEEMQVVVEKLLSDDEEWHRVSKRCRAYMERHHSDAVVLEPYLTSFEQAYALRRPA